MRRRLKKKKKNKKYPHCVTFMLLNSSKFQMEKKASCSWAQGCGQKQAHPLEPTAEYGRWKWANTETNPLQKAAIEIHHRTCWILYHLNVSVHVLSTSIPQHILGLDTSLQQLIHSFWAPTCPRNSQELERHISDISATSHTQTAALKPHPDLHGHPYLIHCSLCKWVSPLMASAHTSAQVCVKKECSTIWSYAQVVPFVKSNLRNQLC